MNAKRASPNQVHLGGQGGIEVCRFELYKAFQEPYYLMFYVIYEVVFQKISALRAKQIVPLVNYKFLLE